MATKSAPKSTTKSAAASKPAARKAKAPAKAAPKAGAPSAEMFAMPDAAQLAKYAKTLTPEQAFELYRANAKLALDVIDAAIESTAKMRKLQFEGEEQARSMQKKAARRAAEAGDAAALMAAGQSVTQEAVDGVLEPDVRSGRRDPEAVVHADGRSDVGHARRQAGEGGDGDDARHVATAECRFGDAGRDVIRRLGVRVDAEGDGRLRAHVGHQALSAACSSRGRGGAGAVTAPFASRAAAVGSRDAD
jgi:hypothetical protein